MLEAERSEEARASRRPGPLRPRSTRPSTRRGARRDRRAAARVSGYSRRPPFRDRNHTCCAARRQLATERLEAEMAVHIGEATAHAQVS